jgi:hypothetical protein
MPRRAWLSGDEPALEITCGSCDEQTFISLMRLRMLAFVRCGCGNMLLDEDEVREYRQRLERDDR